jgi:hypothetical protein
MKKVVFISGVVLVNLILLMVAASTFNPLNLPLTELKYFSGFNIAMLFPGNPIDVFMLYGSVIGLVMVNRFVYKNRTVQ